MKIKLKRRSSSNSAAVPTIASGEDIIGEPVWGKSTVGSTDYQTLFIGGTNNTTPSTQEWKKVSMAEFTPAYENAGQNPSVSGSIAMYSFWFGTQTQYDAITTKDPNTFYFITQ